MKFVQQKIMDKFHLNVHLFEDALKYSDGAKFVQTLNNCVEFRNFVSCDILIN
jgi:hypothetical protein